METDKLKKAIEVYNGVKADAQGLASKSRKTRRLFTDSLTSFFAGKVFHLPTCRDFLTKKRQTNKPESMVTIVKNLRAFVRFCVDYEYMETDFAKRLDTPKVPKVQKKHITESEAKEAIIEGTKPREDGAENKLALASKRECRMALLFLLYTGLRHTEVRTLQVEDFDFSEETFVVHSKGGNIETANIPMNMIEDLKTWCSNRTGRMFAVSEDSMRRAYHRGLAKLGLRKQRVHDLRHVFAKTRLSRRVPDIKVSKLLRHKKGKYLYDTYSDFMAKEMAPDANNSPEIQKSATTEANLDNLENMLRTYGIDPRFEVVRSKDGIMIVER